MVRDGVSIAGATSSSFTPTATQIGKRISVEVLNGSSFWSKVSTGPTFEGMSHGAPNYQGPNSPPAFGYAVSTSTAPVATGILSTSTATIHGIPAVGFTLTAYHGTWTAGTSFSYAWYANGVYITGTSGPTHKSFQLTSAQQGKRISVKVTGKKSGYTTVRRTSAQTPRIALTSAPTISGTFKVGYTLYAHHGTWTSGTTFVYKWYYSDGTYISGSTSTSGKLKLMSAHGESTSASWPTDHCPVTRRSVVRRSTRTTSDDQPSRRCESVPGCYGVEGWDCS